MTQSAGGGKKFKQAVLPFARVASIGHQKPVVVGGGAIHHNALLPTSIAAAPQAVVSEDVVVLDA